MTEALFDRTFAIRARRLQSFEETETHRAFCRQLFVACSPLAAVLPAPLLRLQADAQYASHGFVHASAMRRIVARDGEPIGRIVIDWSLDPVLGVDIAVLPHERASGAGAAMLRAWLDAADRTRRRCALTVLRGNPAARLYARLGFVAIDDDGCDPTIAMMRAPRPA